LGAEGQAAVEAGGVVVEVVEQGASPGPPDTGDLDGWIQTYGLEITTVRPKDGATMQLEGREWAYIVDLDDMKIVWKAFGSYGSTNNSSATQGLAELSTLLGN
jgi:hypothetical protein